MLNRTAFRASARTRLLFLVLMAVAAPAQSLLTDNFTKDTLLNPALWSALVSDAAQNRREPQHLHLTSTDAELLQRRDDDVRDYRNLAGHRHPVEQSIHAAVHRHGNRNVGTVSNGNTFLVNLANSTYKQSIEVVGNLNPANVSGNTRPYGIQIFTTGAGSPVVYASPGVNVEQVHRGDDHRNERQGQCRGLLLRYSSGIPERAQYWKSGPFYLILGPGALEGLPYTVGPTNTAIAWQQS